jgi:hypothetical protein
VNTTRNVIWLYSQVYLIDLITHWLGDENRVKINCRIYIAPHDYPLQSPRFKLSMQQGEMSIRNFDIPESMKNLILDTKAMSTRDKAEAVDLSLKDIERELNETFVSEIMGKSIYV